MLTFDENIVDLKTDNMTSAASTAVKNIVE